MSTSGVHCVSKYRWNCLLCHCIKKINMGKSFTTNEVRNAILLLKSKNKNISAISKELNISRTTVRRWISRSENSKIGYTPQPKIRSGRPRKTSVHTENLLKREVLKNPFITARKLKENHNNLLNNVTVRSVQRLLKNRLNLGASKPARKPILTETMRKKRLQFANRYKDWTAEEWKRVMFSDESTFRVSDVRFNTVRRPSGSNRYDSRFTIKTRKHPESVMIWGCFCSKGRGGLFFLPKNVTMNAIRYKNVLEDHLIQFLQIHDCSVFMQDGAPCHKAKLITEWLKNKNITLLDWPGNSPDLNPIENMWSIMKLKLQNEDCSTVEKLKKNIQILWCKHISTELCEKLALSMPRRIEMVIKAKGGMTKY